ncbi:hypothetical protein D3C72_761470 [compost metagenome]
MLDRLEGQFDVCNDAADDGAQDDVQLLQFLSDAVHVGRVAAGAVDVLHQENVKLSPVRRGQHLEQPLASHGSGAATFSVAVAPHLHPALLFGIGGAKALLPFDRLVGLKGARVSGIEGHTASRLRQRSHQ